VARSLIRQKGIDHSSSEAFKRKKKKMLISILFLREKVGFFNELGRNTFNVYFLSFFLFLIVKGLIISPLEKS